MPETDYLIQRFGLQPHPEGGHYREMHRSPQRVHSPRHGTMRHAYTSIYFLLPPGQFSAWHRITSDETWFHHAGGDVLILYFDAAGVLRTQAIGPTSSDMQFTIPANTWFAARPMDAKSYCFVSCVVGPGFEFADFELASRDVLRAEFGTTSENCTAIETLCREYTAHT
jgi:hypothetical protein